jgi:hypothetical protein
VNLTPITPYEDVFKSFRTGCLERELQMVRLSATWCSYMAILWVSLVSFAAITLYVTARRVFIVVVYYVHRLGPETSDILTYLYRAFLVCGGTIILTSHRICIRKDLTQIHNGSGAHPASYPMATRLSFPGGKTAVAWSKPLSPSSAEVKNAWAHTSTPSIRTHSIVKEEGQLYLWKDNSVHRLKKPFWFLF